MSAYIGIRQPSDTPVVQRQDTLSLSSEASDHELEISASLSSYMRVQHSVHFLTGTTTPYSRKSYPTSLRLSGHSDINASPIMRTRSWGRSRDDGDEGEITGIHYPPSWGQHQSLPRQSPAAGYDESFHSVESLYHTASPSQPKKKAMVSLKNVIYCAQSYIA